MRKYQTEGIVSRIFVSVLCVGGGGGCAPTHTKWSFHCGSQPTQNLKATVLEGTTWRHIISAKGTHANYNSVFNTVHYTRQL